MSASSPQRRERDSLATADLSHATLAAFDCIIDVRSPSEYSLDHLPGAVNHPVLNDEERAQVGTMYKQESPFSARKIGATLVARNIAAHIEQHFADQPKTWRPLVYCWRGGMRSGAMQLVMRAVGWQAVKLEGGYRDFRSLVRDDLDKLPQGFHFRVLCGRTGSGKSTLLTALAQQGAQVLDLELLACHRGSVLGDMPGEPQPSQKAFESAIWSALHGFDPGRPVWVEAESKKVGTLRVPDTLMLAMHSGECVLLETERSMRVRLLQADYRHLIENPPLLFEKLDCLKALHSGARITEWKQMAQFGDWPGLVDALLEHHYDPAYRASMFRNYRRLPEAMPVSISDIGPEAVTRLARELAST